MTDPTPREIDDFLRQLTDLTRATGVVIGGCGCCGSPFLYRAKASGAYKYDPSHMDSDVKYCEEGD